MAAKMQGKLHLTFHREERAFVDGEAGRVNGGGSPKMKIALSIAVILVILSSVPLFARQANAGTQANATASAGGVQAGQSAEAGAQAGPASAQAGDSASASARFEPVSCELLSKLDSKSAKVGDAVAVKTRDKVLTAEGTVIPKGSRLIGHVTDVEAQGEGHANSSMAIVFDRAELKGGQNLAIHSVIESIAPPVRSAAASSMESDEPMGGAMAAGSQPMGIGRAGGGLAGEAVGGASATAAGLSSNAGAASAGALQTAGAGLQSSEAMATEASAHAGSGLHGTADAAGSFVGRGSSVPGVMLAGDGSGTASGTLSASRKNIHLDSGTQIILGVAMAR